MKAAPWIIAIAPACLLSGNVSGAPRITAVLAAPTVPQVSYRIAKVEGLDIFYREAGLGATQEHEAISWLPSRRATDWQYSNGVKDRHLVGPDAATHDLMLLDCPGNADVELDLFPDISHLRLTVLRSRSGFTAF